MYWLFLTLIAVMGFTVVKLRRKRKARQARETGAYSESKAA